MRLVNDQLRKQMRDEATHCGWCSKPLRHRAEVHHIRARGQGGGRHMDHPFNLIVLGGPWDCGCHDLATNGDLTRYDFMAKIAANHGILQDDVERELNRLALLDKYGRLPPGRSFE